MKAVSYINPTDAKRKLRLYVCLFVLALAIPIAVLVARTYKQLESENFYQHRLAAERVAWRMNSWVQQILEPEEKRNFDEYSFLNVSQNQLLLNTQLTTSPLSEIPPRTAVPGVVGYFQINPDGSFQSPILPEAVDIQTEGQRLGLSPDELRKRIALKQTLQDILASSDKSEKQEKKAKDGFAIGEVKPQEAIHSAAAAKPSAVLDNERDDLNRKSLGQKLDSLLAYQKRSVESPIATGKGEAAESRFKQRQEGGRLSESVGVEKSLQASGGRAEELAAAPAPVKQADDYRARRKESVVIPQQSTLSDLQNALDELNYIQREQSKFAEETIDLDITKAGKKNSPVEVTTFEGELDPFQTVILGDKYLVLFRKAWRSHARYVQGFILEQQQFFQPFFDLALGETYGENFTVRIMQDGKTLLERKATKANARAQNETWLYSAFLDAPLDGLQLGFLASQFPRSFGSKVVDMLSLVLTLVLLLGSYSIYRLGASQIEVAKQRSDFVSAVSHELKTPLTSIRMYGEMLRSGMVKDGEKLKSYYDFIFFESERLSRLISNVLQLARLTNSDSDLELKNVKPQSLLDLVRSKTSTQIEAAGFQAKYLAPENVPQTISVLAEEDAFCQIFINLVDNAIKFSAKSEIKRIELGYRMGSGQGEVTFFVRDHGPGVPKDQLKRIFQLFYRAENEMTRTTTGTGIGLALVNELAAKMDAKVDVRNVEPGAEFSVSFRNS